MRGSDNGHEYLVIHTWETKGLPLWAINMNVTEAGKKECEESKIMWVYDYYLYFIYNTV